MSLPYVTASQAANQLGLSDSRIRQLVGEGKFPRPVVGLGRALLFNRADVDAYASVQRTTCVASMYDRPSDPLKLVKDVVWNFSLPRLSDSPHPVHVRLYTGPDRAVALLSEPIIGTARLLTNYIEDIVTGIERDILDGVSAADVTWIDIWPDIDAPTDCEVRLTNPILTRDDPRDPDRWSSRSWSGITLNDLDDLLGGADVDFFYWKHYTVAFLQQWRRTGQPVTCKNDLRDERECVDAYELLARPAAAATLGDAVIAAAHRALLGELALCASEPTYEDLLSYRKADTPKVTAMRLVPYEVPPAIAAARPTVEVLSQTAFDAAESDYQLLDAATDAVDEDSAHPTLELETALARACEAQLSILTLIDVTRSRSVHPQPRPRQRTFTPSGPWDEVYLARCTWLNTDPRTAPTDAMTPRQARQVDPGKWVDQRTFGTDLDRNPVCKTSVTTSNGTTRIDITVLWPTASNVAATHLADDVHIVSHAGAGERPVYLTRHGDIVGLLPITGTYGEWNYGYNGGGPRKLVDDIAAFLTTAGYTVDRPQLEAIITNPQANQGLDIPINTIAATP